MKMPSFLNRFGLPKKSAKHEGGERREEQNERPIVPQLVTTGEVRSPSGNRIFTILEDVGPPRSDEERYVYVTATPAPAGSRDGERGRRRESRSINHGGEDQSRRRRIQQPPNIASQSTNAPQAVQTAVAPAAAGNREGEAERRRGNGAVIHGGENQSRRRRSQQPPQIPPNVVPISETNDKNDRGRTRNRDSHPYIQNYPPPLMRSMETGIVAPPVFQQQRQIEPDDTRNQDPVFAAPVAQERQSPLLEMPLLEMPLLEMPPPQDDHAILMDPITVSPPDFTEVGQMMQNFGDSSGRGSSPTTTEDVLQQYPAAVMVQQSQFMQSPQQREILPRAVIMPSRKDSEETSSTIKNSIEEASPILRRGSSSVQQRLGRENDPAASLQDEDIQPLFEMDTVKTPNLMVKAIWELCNFSIEIRTILNNEAQSMHDSTLRREHVEYYLDRIAHEVSMIVQLVREQRRAKEDTESSEKGPLRKLARMLEKIAKGSVPTIKNILKVGITGSAVGPLSVVKTR
jgi:hypothetical protein